MAGPLEVETTRLRPPASGCFDPIDVPTGVACKNGVAGLAAQGRYAGIETRRFCASGAPWGYRWGRPLRRVLFFIHKSIRLIRVLALPSGGRFYAISILR